MSRRGTPPLVPSPSLVSFAALLAAGAALALLPTPSRAVPSFTELLRFGSGRATITVAWADADLDGRPDVAVGNTNNGQKFVYWNEGAYNFTEAPAFGLRNTFALAWADVDNDGDPDMAVGNALSGPQNRLAINNGGRSFTGQNQFGVHQTIALAWADYDRDGDLDLAVGNGILNQADQNYLYINNGDGTWTEQQQFGSGKSCSVVWGDVNGDGYPDLAVGKGGFGFVAQNYLYINNGDGSFTERADFGMGDTSCLSFGDYDNDGDLDLAVANWNGGQSYLYVNDGAGNFTQQLRFGIGDPNTVSWGDFDDDGDLDLAQGNGDFTSAAPNTLWVNNSDGTFSPSAQFGLASTDAVAWGDVDGDGDLDLAVGNEHSPAQNYLYVNNANDAAWLALHLVGHGYDHGAGYSNRDGVGAKVLVYAAGFLGDPAHLLGFREIEAHGGFSAQSQIDAHFGLPGRSTVDVRIVWPGSAGSHLTQDLPGVSVPGRFVIDEAPTVTAAPLVSAAPAFSRIFPNPSRADVMLELARPATGAADMLVYDAAGRLVRRLHGVDAGADAIRATWDGRGGDGRTTGAGVYFVRVPGSTKEAARIVRLSSR